MTELRRALAARGVEARDAVLSRALYAADASLHRVVPQAVALPRSTDDIASCLAVARELGVPVTMRGAGTSVAGNAVGPGLVVDTSRYLDRVVSVDPDARLARVQPGVVQATLQAAAAPFGLRFGPDPSTSSRCTIGGMIGNDACGSRSLGYGRTSHNVESLTLLTASGEELDTRSRAGFATGIARLDALAAEHLAVLRTEFGRFERQVSGYALHHLLPERGRDLTRAVVGSEGTLGVVTEAVVRLVPEPAFRRLVVLGFDSLVTAAAAVPDLLAHPLTACEGLDSRIVDAVRGRGLPDLPPGNAWLLVETAAETLDEVEARTRALAASAGVPAREVGDAEEAAALWRVRADGAGLAGRSPAGRPAWPGWEDAAVPPERLADYLRDLEELLTDHGLTAMPFGHFGDGCVHMRLDFPLGDGGGAERMRAFLTESARLVGSHGGSLSGEHGDGRARSELLPHMYSPAALALMAAVKHTFDPYGLLNPGVLVDPEPIIASLRTPWSRRDLSLAYPADNGDFGQAIHRCTGVGRCRETTPRAGSVMCPSFLATREEKDSTRGRARVLQEMLDGSLVDGWRDPAVHQALDLCLACKGCLSDCPTGVDMASWKAEVLHQAHRRRLRPRSHYTLGWLPRWAALAARLPRLANALASSRVGLWLAGVDPRRSVPRFVRPFRAGTAARGRGGKGSEERAAGPRAAESGAAGAPVVLFVDSFTNHFAPHVAEAAVELLLAAGYTPEVSSDRACCGLTWISTGQLDAARRRMSRTVELLAPHARAGVPIVGLEPSCTAALKHDAVELLDSADAREVAGSVRTLAEVLLAAPWEPPSFDGVEVVVQPHCHQHAVLGFDADLELLRRTGATVHRLGGCCGLAGNFGVERGHYETSVAVAGLQLLPALERHPDAVYLADGFSCRTQAADLARRPGVHLAELLTRRTADSDPPNRGF